MTLYLISCDDPSGENMDLFVFAESPQMAVAHWSDHFDLSGNAVISDNPTPAGGDIRVITVPQSGLPGAMPWEVVEQTFFQIEW